jgi:quinol monooxygenase YgiN
MTTDTKSITAREVLQASQRLTALDQNAGYITIINRYAVSPERADELVDLLVRATVETMRRYLPGFVVATFQISVDRTRLVNYTQWRSRESIEAARADPKVAALLREAAQFADGFNTVPIKDGGSKTVSSA